MQQLNVEQKIIEKQQSEQEQIKRECKGRALAISRNVFRIDRTDSFYCQSENNENVYYFIRYSPDVLTWCSCPDSSTRGMKCKHQFGVEYAISLEHNI